jgi:1-acyl-sn-glycerol-3-phosphate acyltransferase
MKLFYRLTCFFLKGYFYIFHQHKVYGVDHLPPGPCILAPNHASFLDPPLMAISCPEEAYFLARASLFKSFILRTLIHNLNAYPVTGTAQNLASFKMICQLLQEGKKVVIFPEGIRSSDGNLTLIKSGIGMLAMRCKCPIVPVYLHGTFAIWPRQRKFPRFSGKTACVFGSPISWEKFHALDKKQANEEIAQHLQQSIESLRHWYETGVRESPP